MYVQQSWPHIYKQSFFNPKKQILYSLALNWVMLFLASHQTLTNLFLLSFINKFWSSIGKFNNQWLWQGFTLQQLQQLGFISFTQTTMYLSYFIISDQWRNYNINLCLLLIGTQEGGGGRREGLQETKNMGIVRMPKLAPQFDGLFSFETIILSH